MTTDDPGSGGETLRNVVPITGNAQTQIRVTIAQNFTANSLTLDHVSIGIDDGTGTGSTTATPTEITFVGYGAGAHGVTVPSGGPDAVSDWVNFNGFTSANLLTVIIDIAAAGNHISFAAGTAGATAYAKNGTASYNVQTVAGYTVLAGRVYNVKLIEVQTAGVATSITPITMGTSQLTARTIMIGY